MALKIRQLPKGGGIYKIQNNLTGEMYIGSTKCFITRLTNHKKEILKGHHKNKKLFKAIITYGLLNFSFEPIEYCEDLSKHNLLKLENEYIVKYDTINNGYNINDVPKLSKNQEAIAKKLTTKLGRKISKAKLSNREALGKEYKVIDPNGQIITIKNISLYCNNNDLYIPAFRRMANGGRNYKGYKYIR